MIIGVQGTHYGNNEAVKVLNALAVMGVIKDQNSTLILQFTNKTRKSAEKYLIGKTLQNESLIANTSIPDITVGMDALLAQALGAESSEKFYSGVSRVLEANGTPNVFDIVISSRKESFERELLNKQQKSATQDHDYFEILLKMASQVYKMVFILMPSKNQPLCQELLKFVDINLICVHQGNVEPVTHGGKQEMYIATDYCSGSAFNSKTLAQMYGQKIIYGCMHDIAYNDACANGTALEFLKQNITSTKDSRSYPLIHNIEILYNAITRKTDRKTEDVRVDEEIIKYDSPRLIQIPWTPITETVVREVVTTGIFKKHTDSLVRIQPGPENSEDTESDNIEEVVDYSKEVTEYTDSLLAADEEDETPEGDSFDSLDCLDIEMSMDTNPQEDEVPALETKPVKKAKRAGVLKKKVTKKKADTEIQEEIAVEKQKEKIEPEVFKEEPAPTIVVPEIQFDDNELNPETGEIAKVSPTENEADEIAAEIVEESAKTVKPVRKLRKTTKKKVEETVDTDDGWSFE